ncbi:MAG TPA: DUF4249 domain-containing protein [Chitinophagaceae bacterium]
MRRLLSILCLLILATACEKSINFSPRNADTAVVVEASIENGRPPIVILSNSMDYFSKITPDILANSFIHGADVYVSNGTVTSKLKEYSVSTGVGYSVYYYSVDSTSPSTIIGGEFNKTYSLRIIINGKEYTSATTIPALAKRVDSLWWIPAPSNPDSNKVVVMSRVTDPPGFGNYIRYYTKVNDSAFYPPPASVFDDQIIDGTTYVVEVEHGVDRNGEIDFDTYSFFERGDTVTLKFTNIDKATYDFWRTIEFSYGSIGNPFSSPTKVLGNVKGALGYFGGYAAQYRTIVIPK